MTEAKSVRCDSMRLRLLVTTVVRRSGLNEPSGYLYVIDYPRGRILLRSPIPDSKFRAKDPNPRGGMRGGRGVAAFADRIVIANTDSVWIFDRNWQFIRRVSNPLMVGVHDILAEQEGILITCTHLDLLVMLDWSGNVVWQWEWQCEPQLLSDFGIRNLPILEEGPDYRDPDTLRGAVRNLVHLNAVSRSGDDLLLSFGRVLSPSAHRKLRLEAALARTADSLRLKRLAQRSIFHALDRLRLPFLKSKFYGSRSVIVRLANDGTVSVLYRSDSVPRRDENSREPNHNVLKVGDHLVYNESNRNCVMIVSNDVEAKRVTIPGRPPFVRGLAQLDKRRVIVGSQAPTALYEIDLGARRVVSSCELESSRESVYAICILPPEFIDPPPRLKGF